MSSSSYWGLAWQFTLIYVLIILIVGAILFWIVHKFVWDLRLGILLKILVGLLCLAAILERVSADFIFRG
jgi:uncharacterized membrane protein